MNECCPPCPLCCHSTLVTRRVSSSCHPAGAAVRLAHTALTTTARERVLKQERPPERPHPAQIERVFLSAQFERILLKDGAAAAAADGPSRFSIRLRQMAPLA